MINYEKDSFYHRFASQGIVQSQNRARGGANAWQPRCGGISRLFGRAADESGIEFPAPESVIDVRAKVADADALWIFSPEYNYSYPGHLKNLIDWLSRPLVPGDRQTPIAINGKKVTLSGAGGASQTAKCREKLTELLTLPFIRADVMTEPQAGITLNKEAWTEGCLILTDEQKSDLRLQAEAFLCFIG